MSYFSHTETDYHWKQFSTGVMCKSVIIWFLYILSNNLLHETKYLYAIVHELKKKQNKQTKN